VLRLLSSRRKRSNSGHASAYSRVSVLTLTAARPRPCQRPRPRSRPRNNQTRPNESLLRHKEFAWVREMESFTLTSSLKKNHAHHLAFFNKRDYQSLKINVTNDRAQTRLKPCCRALAPPVQLEHTRQGREIGTDHILSTNRSTHDTSSDPTSKGCEEHFLHEK
jgi:hypothetical protein